MVPKARPNVEKRITLTSTTEQAALLLTDDGGVRNWTSQPKRHRRPVDGVAGAGVGCAPIGGLKSAV